jgi:hypothetical protein
MDEHNCDTLRIVEPGQGSNKIEIGVVGQSSLLNIDEKNPPRPAVLTTSGALADAEQVADRVNHAHELHTVIPRPRHRVRERFPTYIRAVPSDQDLP